MNTPSHPSLALWIPLLLSAAVAGQGLPRVGDVAPYGYVSPPLDYAGAGPEVVHHHAVHRPGASFLGLCLRDVVLGPGSRIEIRSRRDGDSDVISPGSWSAARPWTAYLNGDTVDVRLVAGIGTRGNRFTIASVAIGNSAIPGPATLCNANDTRQLWIDGRVCRLMLNDGIGVGVGTGWLIDYKSRLVTAGHVLQAANLQSIQAQFNVPRSNANGTLVMPPVTSQYPWNPDPARRASQNPATGPDWGVFEILPNTSSQLYAAEAQRNVFTLQTPSSTMTEAIVMGFGTDDTPDLTYQHVLQTARGSASSIPAIHKIQYRVDTTSGVSGGPVLDVSTGAAIGVHEGGSCSTDPLTNNFGWSIAEPTFESERNRLSPDLPDLVARSIGAPARVATDNRYNVSVQATNLGRRPAVAFRIGIYLSTDQTITTTDSLLVTLSFPALNPGQGGVLGNSIVVPGTVAPGSYWIGMIADDQSAVTEGDETDNTRSRPIDVYRGTADLVAGVDVALFPGPSVYQPGQVIAAPIVVFNRGDAPSPPSVTAIIHTRNVGMPLGDHIILALVPTPGLAPNQSWTTTHNVVIPWCARNRAGDIGCYADADEVIGEISEANNFGTYTGRGIGNYSLPERRIAWHPQVRTGARTQDTATFRSTAGGDVGEMCIQAGNTLPAHHYLLIWSFQSNPFVFDPASEFSLAMLNGPLFTRWFSSIDEHGPYRARLTFPSLGAPVTATIWTHGLYLDAQFQVTGWAPTAIENRIVP